MVLLVNNARFGHYPKNAARVSSLNGDLDRRCQRNDVDRLSYCDSTTNLLDQTNGLFGACTRRFDGHWHEINATDDNKIIKVQIN